MKKIMYALTTTCLLPLLTLSAENSTSEDSFFESLITDSENSIATLQEELQLLDQEFETLNEELFSTKEQIAEPVHSEPPQVEEIQGLIAENIEELPQSEDVSAAITAVVETPLISPEIQEEAPSLIALETAFPEEAQPSIATLSPQMELPETPALLNVNTPTIEPAKQVEAITVDFNQAFAGAPVIYSLLLGMSVFALSIWLYSLVALKRATQISHTLSQKIQSKLTSNQFEEALALCEQSNNLLSKMIISGIQTRKHGIPVMVEAMKAEGKRASVRFWQKISMLNDIAIIAPMLGLLGTVLGMFYAFYNINRSIESISTLFDGLGVSVGTTVAGLIVAILALILHSIAKYRLVRSLSIVESEAQTLANYIDDRTSLYNKG